MAKQRLTQAARENIGGMAAVGALPLIASVNPIYPHGLIAAGIGAAIGAGVGVVKTAKDTIKARRDNNPNLGRQFNK